VESYRTVFWVRQSVDLAMGLLNRNHRIYNVLHNTMRRATWPVTRIVQESPASNPRVHREDRRSTVMSPIPRENPEKSFPISLWDRVHPYGSMWTTGRRHGQRQCVKTTICADLGKTKKEREQVMNCRAKIGVKLFATVTFAWIFGATTVFTYVKFFLGDAHDDGKLDLIDPIFCRSSIV
jgi:hypothetical protein